jgi:HK97 family phage portal protein
LANILSTIASWFRTQRTSQVHVWTTGTTEVYPTIDSTTAIEKGFNGNAAVYSIVKKDAKKFGSVPRYVERTDDSEEEIEGPLADLLNNPNEYQGQDAFLSLARAFYKICGETFIWLNRGDTAEMMGTEFVEISDEAQMKKPVLEMYVLPANKVIIVPDPGNIFGVYGYILESNVRVPIRKVDMIHWKDLNLSFDVLSRTHLRGMSPLVPGNKILEQNNSATDAAVRMNQNGGAKGALVNKSMAQMNPIQETQLRNVIDNKINSNDVKNAVSAFQGDWSYLNFGLTSVDMELLKGKDYTMKELCFLFGLPFELFDSETTYANKEMAQKGWVINEIMPDCKQFDNELNRVLIPAFGLEGTGEICSDFDELAELQEDKGKQVEWLMKAPVTMNEVRDALGYEETTEPEADEILIPSGLVKLSDMQGDGGQTILEDLYNANGTTNRSNGNGEVPKNGQGKKRMPAGKGKA